MKIKSIAGLLFEWPLKRGFTVVYVQCKISCVGPNAIMATKIYCKFSKKKQYFYNKSHSGSVGRALDLGSKGSESHCRHCVVSLSKTHNPLLSAKYWFNPGPQEIILA